MAIVGGDAGFTQLTKLNILDELRIQGVKVLPAGGQDIVEVIADYDQEIDDDILFVTGSFTVTLVAPGSGIKSITIRCISGTTTIAATSGTVETPTLTVGQSITMAPRSSGWFNV